jgi:hypothetical protein
MPDYQLVATAVTNPRFHDLINTRREIVLHIDPDAYAPACAALLPSDSLSPLGPGRPDDTKRAALEGLDEAALLAPQTVRHAEMAQCCLAALWLRHGFLDHSHAISQGIATTSGSYWHGIMHRREPDYSNAKYWFRRVGDHPLFEALQHATAQLLSDVTDHEAELLRGQRQWDPNLFIDLCQEVAGSDTSGEHTCRLVADLEWELLFDFCYRHAAGRD